ncbi:MAG: hypothetical protein IT375_28170 [Polyangiaceae bacterium]|nr:hypothetical protein [Polyangiaceae bacterium]
MGCSGVSRSDRAFVESAVESGVVQSCENPKGKTAEQTKKAQKAGFVSHGAAEAGLETGAKALAMGTHGAAAIGAGAASVVVSSGMHMLALYKAVAEGAEIRDAHQRDAINLAFVWTASAALPRDYVARQGYELRAVGGERGGASKILTPLMKDDARWQALKSQAESHVRLARSLAAKHGVDSPEALSSRLTKDPRFAKAYQSSMAFRHGVDSVVFEAQQRKIARGN